MLHAKIIDLKKEKIEVRKGLEKNNLKYFLKIKES